MYPTYKGELPFFPSSPIQDKAEFTHIQFKSFQEATIWRNLKLVHYVECYSMKVRDLRRLNVHALSI